MKFSIIYFRSFVFTCLISSCVQLFGSTYKSEFDCCESSTEKVHAFPCSYVTLKPSWIKDREELNLAFVKSMDADRLLHNFRITAALPSDAEPLEGWESPKIGLRGHFVGAEFNLQMQLNSG